MPRLEAHPRRKLPSSKGKSEGGTALSLWGSFLEKVDTLKSLVPVNQHQLITIM